MVVVVAEGKNRIVVVGEVKQKSVGGGAGGKTVDM